MTVSYVSLDESGSNFAIVAATSLLLDVTRGSSEAYLVNEIITIRIYCYHNKLVFSEICKSS